MNISYTIYKNNDYIPLLIIKQVYQPYSLLRIIPGHSSMKRTTIFMDEEIFRSLKELSQEEGKSMAQLVREAPRTIYYPKNL
jgi:hypothetical protein